MNAAPAVVAGLYALALQLLKPIETVSDGLQRGCTFAFAKPQRRSVTVRSLSRRVDGVRGQPARFNLHCMAMHSTLHYKVRRESL